MRNNRKHNRSLLSLHRETLRQLDTTRLAAAAGGFALPTWLPTSDTNGINCLSEAPRLCGGSRACPKQEG